jgi:dolichol-phosphate mannosyltransferase
MINNTVVIIPTYNAKEGILATIASIQKNLPYALVMIVDDNSPDKTADIVHSNYKKDKRVKVIVRNSKDGRGSAVIAGMKEMLKNRDIQYFIEMDADLCHDPKYIIPMIKKCKTVDMVIASKYLPESTIKGLNLKRKIMSRLMNLGARIILQVPITDYSNGFRCYKRDVVEFITRQNLQAKGFVLLSEIVYRVYKKGFTIAEIPFDFKTDNISASNMNKHEVKEAISTLLRLRFSK